MITINFLKAYNGDAINISYNSKNIIIDTGVGATYSSNNTNRKKYGQLKEIIDKIKSKDEKIDLLIITHWDDDHIGGIIRWFNEDPESAKILIQRVWFNSGILINKYFDSQEATEENDMLHISKNNPNTSIRQGIAFEKYLINNSLSYKIISTESSEINLCDNIKFTILSPTDDKLKKLLTAWKRTLKNPNTSISTDYNKPFEELLQNDFSEDVAIHNGSSIAFILEIEDKNMLFLGDAHPNVIINSLEALGYSKENKLQIELMKVSHHGSKANTSDELLELISCDKFIISTNDSSHGLPNKETLARIINKHPNCSIYFNYIDLKSKVFTKEELDNGKFKVLDTSELSI